MKMFMKKSFIKLLPVFLLILLGCMMPKPVKAAESDFIVDKNGVITQYFGPGGNVRIPSVVNGVKVTSIGKMAFYRCLTLTGIIIPEGVVSIGMSAFYDCLNLTYVSIPESVTSIGKIAFYNCDVLPFITIPKNVTSIGSQALLSCDRLSTVYIYNKNVEIDNSVPNSNPTPICGNNTNVTLHGYKNSTIEAYTKKWNYKFALLPDEPNEPDEPENPDNSEKPLIGISLNKPTITIDPDKTSLLQVIYNPADTTDSLAVTWSSSNPAVAHVYSNGKVKGVSVGTAVITAIVGDKTATCNVTVR